MASATVTIRLDMSVMNSALKDASKSLQGLSATLRLMKAQSRTRRAWINVRHTTRRKRKAATRELHLALVNECFWRCKAKNPDMLVERISPDEIGIRDKHGKIWHRILKWTGIRLCVYEPLSNILPKP
jgi:hypothetical protein